MSETFFIGDTHFGHKNIINFSSIKEYRPFSSIEEHDAELVKRWNSVVAPKDKVFMLGDFCFGKRNIDIAGLLNGYKVLIAGNHDLYATEDYLRYFKKIYGACEYKRAILTHIPVHPSQFARYSINIHGHLHVHTIDDPRYFNCSAEQINLTPISYESILERIENSQDKKENG
jgi:calcineurin-like phosphoesterase family protein